MTNATPTYVKFDLNSASLASMPEWVKIKNHEGAYRFSFLVWADSPQHLAQARNILLQPDLEYCAIKAPSLDGTEIWICASRSQARVEQAAGFDGGSQPLFLFEGRQCLAKYLVNPSSNKELPIEFQSMTPPETGVGYSV